MTTATGMCSPLPRLTKTPDTAIGNKRFFSLTVVPPLKLHLCDQPLRVIFTYTRSYVPLLFMYEDSLFLKRLSLWQQLPTPKTLLLKEGEGDNDLAEVWKKHFYE
jgi:hypothetical protein